MNEIFKIYFLNPLNSSDCTIEFMIRNKNLCIDIHVGDIDCIIELTEEKINKLLNSLGEVENKYTACYNNDLLQWHFTLTKNNPEFICLDIDNYHDTLYINESFIQDVKIRLDTLKKYFYG